MDKKIGIIGGGAAGFFCALQTAKEIKRLNKKAKVFILEQGGQVLKKVRISGGGRCNVTHNIFDTKQFSLNYPRGQRELLSPFQSFQAEDTVKWFKTHGIKLVAEGDGRMFPTTNQSETIIRCFVEQAEKLKVNILKNHKVTTVIQKETHFSVQTGLPSPLEFNQLLICTGSSLHGYQLASQLGHTITERAPSLFSFKCKHPLFKDLSGTSFQNTEVKLVTDSGKKFKQEGPLLITHWGLSGPAILKLSAWAAREMKASDYKAKLNINWLQLEAKTILNELKASQAKSHIVNAAPNMVTKRFWQNLLSVCKISSDNKWADINKKQMNALVENLNFFSCNVNGQNRFKDEFVECGGVSLKEINFKTMESKVKNGLHFAGEILDIDGVTGGFNFQNAWTTGWLAANHMAESV